FKRQCQPAPVPASGRRPRGYRPATAVFLDAWLSRCFSGSRGRRNQAKRLRAASADQGLAGARPAGKLLRGIPQALMTGDAGEVLKLGLVRPPLVYLISLISGAVIQLAAPFPFLPGTLALPLGAP